jgi:nitrite reductase/ring-hydroxylating ferredoxin subunit
MRINHEREREGWVRIYMSQGGSLYGLYKQDLTWAHQRRSKGERSVTEMSTIEPRRLAANEFQVSAVPLGSAAQIGDTAVFNVSGNFCATQAKCTHRGGALSPGKLDGSTITCPLHGSQFNVCSGEVLRGPAMDPLMTYRVIVEGDVGRVEAQAMET